MAQAYQEHINKLDRAADRLIDSVRINEEVLSTVNDRLDNQEGIISALPEVSVNTSEDVYDIPSMDDLAEVQAKADSSLATVSAFKSALAVARNDIDNLKALANDTIARTATDDRDAHTTLIGDPEVCGSAVEVAPNGLLNSVGGRTVVWNQKIMNRGTETRNGVTFIWGDDGSLTVKGTATGTAYTGAYIPRKAGRTYYVSGFSKDGSDSTYIGILSAPLSAGGNINIYNGSLIKRYNEDVSSSLYFFVYEGTTVDVKFYPQVFDLTQMFGAGNEPATVEEFEAMVDTSVYHPYCEGELMSLPVREVEVEGRNLWDGKISAMNARMATSNGNTYPFEGYVVSEYIPVSPNAIYYISKKSSGAFYYCWYDAEKKFISGTGALPGYGIESKPNARFIRFDTPLGEQVQFEKGVKSNNFTPYRHHTIDLTRLASLPGYGWSAGTAKNWVDFERGVYVQEVAAVDLGTLTWSYWGEASSIFNSAVIPNCRINSKTEERTEGILCSKYPVSTVAVLGSAMNDKSCLRGDGTIVVRDTGFTSGVSFRESVNGVIVHYELAEPIITPLSELLPDFDLDPTLPGLETGGTVTLIADGTPPDGSVLVPADQLSLPQPKSLSYLYKLNPTA